MPVIPSLILTNQLPRNTYTASVLASASLVAGMDGHLITDGLGNQINLLAVTCSFAHTTSIQTSWEESSSFASHSMWCTTASWASASVTASGYVSASSMVGGLTTTQYFVSGSPWYTMSFVNGILTTAS